MKKVITFQLLNCNNKQVTATVYLLTDDIIQYSTTSISISDESIL